MGVGTLRYYAKPPSAGSDHHDAQPRVIRYEATPLLNRLIDLVGERMKDRATVILH